MSQIVKRGPSSPQMNMTPMIDVTFQLIIFFLLINNIVSEEAVSLIVPKLLKPQTQELTEKQERVVINVIPVAQSEELIKAGKNPLAIKGKGEADFVKVGLHQFPIIEEVSPGKSRITYELEQTKERSPNVVVLLRADAATYYRNVQPVLAAITQAGVETIHLVAYLEDEGPVSMPDNE
jgi:biopolymer transport protein ExbD